MNLTLVKLLILGAAAPLMATAQVAPKPTPEPPKAPAAKPAPRSIKIDPYFEFGPKLDEMRLQLEDMRLPELSALNLDRVRMAEEIKERTLERAMVDLERTKIDIDRVRLDEIDVRTNINVDAIRHQAEEMKNLAMMDLPMRVNAEMKVAEMASGYGIGLGIGGGRRDKLLEARPRQGWSKEDPADSLYRVAREALNRGEYRRAAQTFNEITKKYPRSQYMLSSAYWEAFARYRSGGTDDLREALKILDERSAQFASLGDDGNVDVQALRARVLGALASRGDARAAEELKKNVSQSSSCDREDVSVKAEALGALGQMDMAAAMPVVRKVLQRRDECTVELRRRALYLLARQPSAEAVGLILDVAKNDTDSGIRGDAMRVLPRVAGDSAVPQLEELLRTSTDEQTQRSVINALGSIDSDRARRAIRTIIERNDAAERVRYDAILSLSRERDSRMISTEETTYLRSLYGKLESTKLKEAVLTSVGRIQSTESEQFLLAVARNQNESPSLRASALQRLGRMNTVGVAEIAKLYEVADSRAMREQILSALSQRKEPEAIDKMIDIAKKDTDPQIRRTAINLITRASQGGNERAKKFLQEFFDR